MLPPTPIPGGLALTLGGESRVPGVCEDHGKEYHGTMQPQEVAGRLLDLWPNLAGHQRKESPLQCGHRDLRTQKKW